ncbi:DUF4232 domain-containing protein [Streptomyces sp. NPDC048172]|uniref:DUF4232 domain-containing protein n=1 Tax=Streptomyces sp. NPDC048172 TaxID=3365505 RepID=UPI00371D2760
MAPHHAPYARPALAALAATTALIAAGCTAHSSSPASSSADSPKSAAPSASPSSPSSPPPSSSSGAKPEVKGAEGKKEGKEKEGGEGKKSPAKGSAPHGTPWCGTGQLKVSLRSLESGAGQRYAALVLTNSSDAPCRTRGWPGLQLTKDDGGKIPTTTARDRASASPQFTMRPGDRAWSRLHWTVVPGTGDPADGTCPEPGTLRVIPPDQRRALQTEWKLGTVCGGGEVDETALRLGSGPGTAH